MSNKNTKVPITLKIDVRKKMLLESTKYIHGKTFSDVLDEALDRILMEIAPAEFLELRISDTEQYLAELKQNLAEVRFLQEQQKIALAKETQAGKHTDEHDPKTDVMRLEIFNKYKESLAWQKKTNQLDWSRITDLFMFNSKTEARDWLFSQLQEEA